MVLVQTGYYGGVGPVFVTSVSPKVIIWQGHFENGKLVLRACNSGYATILKTYDYFPFQSSECTLDTFNENAVYPEPCDGYREPAYGGNNFEGYRKLILNDWVLIDLSPKKPVTEPEKPIIKPNTNPTSQTNGNSSGNNNNGSGGTTTNGNSVNGNGTVVPMSTGVKATLIGAGILTLLSIVSNQD